MSSIQDKCYHVVCAIPVVQTVVGGAFAIKDIIGIIKDIAMSCLFTDFNKDKHITLKNIDFKKKALNEMADKNEDVFNFALIGTQEEKDLGMEGMEAIQTRLRNNDLLFPLSDGEKDLISSNCSFTEKYYYTKAYIKKAKDHLKKQKTNIDRVLYFTEAVSAKTRFYNLATNIISMIPTYRIGTIYNLATLTYHCIVKA